LIHLNARTVPARKHGRTQEKSLAMWWSYWPTTWFLVAPLMMLACIAGMFVMMRGMHGRCRAGSPGVGIDLDRAGPHITGHFREEASSFEEHPAETLRRLDREQNDFRDSAERLATAKDKVEFDEFMTRLNAGTTSPPGPRP
jgi:Protein of unknown function (DUF2852)